MPLSAVQKNAIDEVIDVLTDLKEPKSRGGKRAISDMFMELVDREEWPEYYEVIPEPRCIDDIQMKLEDESDGYASPTEAYNDLRLVFYNAMWYNEAGSQIYNDAETLNNLLDIEWQKRSGILPDILSTSPPPGAPQRVHPNAPQNAAAVSRPVAASIPPVQPRSAPPVNTTTVPIQIINATPVTPKPITSTPVQPLPVQSRVPVESPNRANGHSSNSVGETYSANVAHDISSDIVRQLERGLPGWPGFSQDGWIQDNLNINFRHVIEAIKNYKDPAGNCIASAIEAIPERDDNIPNLPNTGPISFNLIESRIESSQYSIPRTFDMDMENLFLRARRWYTPSSSEYGRVLALQRFYQALTSSNPPTGPRYNSATNFATLLAGPGNIKPVHGPDVEGLPAVTTYRIVTKDRNFVDELHYKGWSIRLGDWLHLSNPDDPSRPIIAQVFRCWTSEDRSKPSQPGLTVSWYYRPEQTFHSSSRHFWTNEVFKSSHFAEHPLEDIIEKVACQFTARHIRGRPRAPYWYPGFPLYVCDSRYNDRERIFVRLKNWNSCIPEELRQNTEWMPIYPFEETVYPSRHPSPFLSSKEKDSNVKLPGGLLPDDGSHNGGDPGPSKGSYVGASTPSLPPTYSGVHTVQYPPAQPSLKMVADRSVFTAAGGASVAHSIRAEKLQSDTTKHFDRDPDTNEILWFPAPPTNTAPTPKPKYSLTYLHFLAMKRKKEEDTLSEQDSEKRPRLTDNWESN